MAAMVVRPVPADTTTQHLATPAMVVRPVPAEAEKRRLIPEIERRPLLAEIERARKRSRLPETPPTSNAGTKPQHETPIKIREQPQPETPATVNATAPVGSEALATVNATPPVRSQPSTVDRVMMARMEPPIGTCIRCEQLPAAAFVSATASMYLHHSLHDAHPLMVHIAFFTSKGERAVLTMPGAAPPSTLGLALQWALGEGHRMPWRELTAPPSALAACAMLNHPAVAPTPRTAAEARDELLQHPSLKRCIVASDPKGPEGRGRVVIRPCSARVEPGSLAPAPAPDAALAVVLDDAMSDATAHALGEAGLQRCRVALSAEEALRVGGTA